MDLTPRAMHSLRLVESRFWWNLDWLKPLFSGGKEDAIQEPIGGVITASLPVATVKEGHSDELKMFPKQVLN